MIQEASQFDNRLKKLGMEINIDDLIKADKNNKSKGGPEETDSEEEALRKMEEQFKVYDSLEDDPTKVDYSTFGLVTLDEKQILKYFPKNQKGVSFSSKQYNPLGFKPRAPNSMLELDIKEHEE
jgi:hypothetical protein